MSKLTFTAKIARFKEVEARKKTKRKRRQKKKSNRKWRLSHPNYSQEWEAKRNPNYKPHPIDPAKRRRNRQRREVDLLLGIVRHSMKLWRKSANGCTLFHNHDRRLLES